MPNYDIAIIGGGISGLAAAYYLTKLPVALRVLLLEQSEYLGGKIVTAHKDGYLLEGGPDGFLECQPRALNLAKELGLQIQERQLQYHRTFIWRQGVLRPLPSGMCGIVPTNIEALRHSALLSVKGLRRLAAETSIAPRCANNTEESVAAFIKRRFGLELLYNLIEPLAAGIYAGSAARLSMTATFPRLLELERSYGSVLLGLQKEAAAPVRFVSFAGGMVELVHSITAKLVNIDIYCCSPAVQIAAAKRGSGFYIRVPGWSEISSRAIIMATPAHVAGKLLGSMARSITSKTTTKKAKKLAATLAKFPYASVVTINLAVAEHSLNAYGYVVPRRERRKILGCTCCSHKWLGRSPLGKSLLRLYIGRFGGADVTKFSDSRLLAMARQELRQTLGINKVEWAQIQRWPLGLPQYNLGHGNLLQCLKMHALPGLFFAGAYLHGLGVPDCIAGGEAAAQLAAAQFD